jgi:hypothetical protein
VSDPDGVLLGVVHVEPNQEQPLSQPTTMARATPQPEPGGRRWVSPLGAIAAGFTAMCCLGVSAAVSLSTALGATFLTRDATLRPLLAVTLAVTVAGSALTYWRRRQPWPLAVSAASAVWVYSSVYLVGGGHAAHMADHMADHAVSHSAGFSGGRLAAVWVGLVLLVGSQVWDLIGVRRGSQRRQMRCGDGRPR